MDTKREHRTHAEGSPRGNPYDLTYSPSGRLIGKSRDNNSVTLSATVDMAYGYCDDYQPHAVKRMFDYKNGMLYDMRWDEAGNLGQVSMSKPGEMFEAGRFLFWTEDSRMHAAVDDRYTSYYAYDHSGERRLKLTGGNKLLDVNANFMATYTLLSEPTLYPSAYMVLTNKGYTKHYYAGTERVAARMGGGGLDAIGHAIGSNDTLQEKADLLYKQSLDQVNNRVLNKNDLDCIMNSKFAKEEFSHPIDDVPSRMQAGVEPNHDQFKYMMNSMLSDLSQGDEPDVYFYHSDHLGSASWITDFSGMAVQHIQYLPYGEPYINQHPFGYSERFTFTGKEKDAKTGLSYFGARYYESEMLNIWLSVDPMADKYPSMSPYGYCAGNPVKLVDPDGLELCLEDDLIIRGKNNSSITIKTSVVNLEFETNQDLGGNYTVRSENVALGYTTGASATASAVGGTNFTAYSMSAFFLGGDYSGYWYDYIGGDANLNVAVGADVSANIQRNYFVAFFSPDAPTAKPTPMNFSGSYSSFNGNFSVGAGGDIGMNAGFAIGKNQDGRWLVISLGMSLGACAISAKAGVSGGFGRTELLTKPKKTCDRTSFDLIGNLLTHKL